MFSFHCGYFCAKSRFPDLLETLVVRSDGRSCWSRVRCAQGMLAISKLLLLDLKELLSLSRGCCNPQETAAAQAMCRPDSQPAGPVFCVGQRILPSSRSFGALVVGVI